MNENFSLQQNLADAFQGGDPFARAHSQQFTQKPTESSVMDNPFPDIMPASPTGQTEAAPQGPSLNQALPKAMNFMDIAKQMNIDIKGLNGTPDVAKIQLMGRLSKQFGPDYMNRPEVQNLLKAFESHDFDSGKQGQRDLLSMTAKGQRTLKALLGGI